MRDDVQKVFSERPKGGRTWVAKTRRPKPVVMDSTGEQLNESANRVLPRRIKLRAPRPNVLERFLFHRVGQPWDKVYAEVCETADARTKLGAEIRWYLKGFVATECWMDGRKLMSSSRIGVPELVTGLYVHPKSGLLMRRMVIESA